MRMTNWMKKLLIGGVCASLLLSVAACSAANPSSSAQPAAPETTAAAPADMTTAAPAETPAPMTEMATTAMKPADDSAALTAAAYDYFVMEVGQYYDKADVTIPSGSIIATDESNPDDIKVWANFWLFNCNVDGETLVIASGGHFPGLLHLKKTDAGYEGVSFERVDSGTGHRESAMKIFGEHFDAFEAASSNDEETNNMNTKSIADYVKANNIAVTQYQNTAGETIPLS